MEKKVQAIRNRWEKIAGQVFFSFFIIISFLFTYNGAQSKIRIIENQEKTTVSLIFDNKVLSIKPIQPFIFNDIDINLFAGGLPPLPIQQKVTSKHVYKEDSIYFADIVIQNPLQGSIRVSNSQKTDFIDFYFRPFRNLDWGFDVTNSSIKTHLDDGYGIEISPFQSLKLITSLLLAWVPYGMPVLIFYWIYIIFIPNNPKKNISAIDSRKNNFVRNISIGTLLIVLVVSFIWEYYINTEYLEGIPHVPDSVSYVMQAKMIAKGHIYESPKLFPRYFNSFNVGGMMYRNADTDKYPERTIIPKQLEDLDSKNGKWFTQYPFGHPLVLSIGVLLGNIQIIPPLVGVVFLLFLYLFIKEVTQKHFPALVGLLLTVFSPFFQMHAASFMSHNTGALYLILTLFFLVKGLKNFLQKKSTILYLFLSGIFWGFLFNTRPTTALGLFFTALFFIFFSTIKKISLPLKSFFKPPILSFLLGVSLMIIAYFGFNFKISGNPLIPPYYYMGTFSSNKLGFSGGHTLAKGLEHTLTNLSLFESVALGWPSFLTFVFAGIACVIGYKNKYVILNVSSILFIAFFWSLYDGNFIMYGPRFYYEILPLLIFLTTYGITELLNFFYETFLRIYEKNYKEINKNRFILLFKISPAVLIFVGINVLVVFLTYRTIQGWIFHKTHLYPGIIYTPENINELRNFNQSNAALIKEATRENIHNAIIFVKPCAQWWCDNVPFSQNNITLDGDIVWARDAGIRNADLMKYYNNRKYYLGDYDSTIITPITLDSLK